MKKEINIMELFSGIGGFAKGFEDAGFKIKKHYFSEIDKHAIANYQYNYEKAEYIGSVTDIPNGKYTGIDVITFGSPCQDFSLAGQRAGMEGQRSSLVLEAIRLISDIRPSVFIWENVKGAFSSNAGADFWGIIQAFTNIGGYRLEWQLLNTKWFLPQNRERIYLVGHLTERSEPGIFPFGENDFFFTKEKKSDKNRIQTKYSTTVNSRMGGRNTDTFISIPEIARTLTGGGNSGGLHSDMTTIQVGAIRGRNPEKPTQRIAGQYQEQTLEVNNNGISNCLSTVQKDNVVIICEPKHKHGESRTYMNVATTILARYGTSGDNIPYVNNIRRLTEIECERLQGFPDNWTKFGNYHGTIKPIPKTQRYKMLGNAVTSLVVTKIAERIKLI